MGYPQAVATGNAVIAAAIAEHIANIEVGRVMSMSPDELVAEWPDHRDLLHHFEGARMDAVNARIALRLACEAHVAASAVPHVQGPDMDAQS
jgi:3-polyprenyl-4-hydroxybenzoate decarboxylase